MSNTVVSTEFLSTQLDNASWVVIDCRFTLTDTEAGRRAYATGHISGARYAHLDEDLSSPVTPTSGRHPLPDPAAFCAKLGDWGITPDSQVVVYDDSFGSMAVRLWWLLRGLGHTKVALLDGGLPKWAREKLDTPPPAAVDAKITDLRLPHACAIPFLERVNRPLKR